jgi:hypothetical protein
VFAIENGTTNEADAVPGSASPGVGGVLQEPSGPLASIGHTIRAMDSIGTATALVLVGLVGLGLLWFMKWAGRI